MTWTQHEGPFYLYIFFKSRDNKMGLIADLPDKFFFKC